MIAPVDLYSMQIERKLDALAFNLTRKFEYAESDKQHGKGDPLDGYILARIAMRDGLLAACREYLPTYLDMNEDDLRATIEDKSLEDVKKMIPPKIEPDLEKRKKLFDALKIIIERNKADKIAGTARETPVTSGRG